MSCQTFQCWVSVPWLSILNHLEDIWGCLLIEVWNLINRLLRLLRLAFSSFVFWLKSSLFFTGVIWRKQCFTARRRGHVLFHWVAWNAFLRQVAWNQITFLLLVWSVSKQSFRCSKETILVNYNTSDSLSNYPRAVPKLKLYCPICM